MSFKILDQQYDNVIKSQFFTVVTNYEFALANLVPLIDKLEFQRSPLRAKFYERLERDIITGCIMPSLTIAIKLPTQIKIEAEDTLKDALRGAFVLDGIQRLNTLDRIKDNLELDKKRPLYINILICDSMDKLLYRMITLNNGQKPMTARHQIEVLAKNIFDFNKLAILTITEKQKKPRKKNSDSDYMNKENVIKAYMAYVSGSINIDNQKIIESKMDELITEQIIQSDITSRENQFQDVIEYIEKCIKYDAETKDWMSIANNFIGFSAAMSKSFDQVSQANCSELSESIKLFEKAFMSFNVSKIKLGLSRRRMVKYYFENFNKFSKLDVNALLNQLSMEL